MASNQLLDRQTAKQGKVTVEILEKLAADMNGEWWVRRMGRHYFVKREKNPKFVDGSADPKEREFIHTLAWTG